MMTRICLVRSKAPVLSAHDHRHLAVAVSSTEVTNRLCLWSCGRKQDPADPEGDVLCTHALLGTKIYCPESGRLLVPVFNQEQILAVQTGGHGSCKETSTFWQHPSDH